jgi:hypothetical protein
MSNKQMSTELGFDLTHPLISQPGPKLHKAGHTVGAVHTQEITGGFDLRWPLLSRPEQSAEVKDKQKRAA